MHRFLPVVIAVAAAVYFTQAYLPVGLAYYRAQRAARAYALASAGAARSPDTVEGLVAAVRREAGIDVDPGEVHVRREGETVTAVRFNVKVPLQFPLVGGGRTMRFAIAAGPRGEE